MNNLRRTLLIALLAALPAIAPAAVKLPAFFSDHMVLQRDKPVALWGWADVGEKVTVRIAGQRLTAVADRAGKWSVTLQPLKPGRSLELTVEASNTITVKDVLVGEVWLASGQSNMAFRLAGAARAKEEIAAARREGIRVFTVQEQFAQATQKDVMGRWQICTPEVAEVFSAVAYFFGCNLHTNLNVPVGLIVSSVGGTPIESWTAHDVLAADPESRAKIDAWKNVTPEMFQQIATTYREFQQQRSKRAAAVARGESPPELKPPTKRCHDCPSALFDGMIAPLIPYTLRGVIWYQGESNTSQPARYEKLFPALIWQWRRDWREQDLPFYFVQLANYAAKDKSGDSYAVLREAQRKTLSLPNTGMAVAIDIGEANDIHPRNKQEVGRRLALWALAKTYGRQGLVYSGPLCDSLLVHGDTATVRFHPTSDALLAQGGSLNGFEVAGRDGKFVRAEASVSGHTVKVRSEHVSQPVSVRYAWANNPEGCNLYNSAGLPASPFSTSLEIK